MSRMRRNLLFLCVVFPRGLVAVVLMDTGRGGGREVATCETNAALVEDGKTSHKAVSRPGLPGFTNVNLTGSEAFFFTKQLLLC